MKAYSMAVDILKPGSESPIRCADLRAGTKKAAIREFGNIYHLLTGDREGCRRISDLLLQLKAKHDNESVSWPGRTSSPRVRVTGLGDHVIAFRLYCYE